MFSDYLRRGSATNKFFSILFSIVLVIGLIPITAWGTEGEAPDQQEAQTASTQATSTSNTDVEASDIEATVGGEQEQNNEATQASDSEASSDVVAESTAAATAAESGIAPMSEEDEGGIVPQAGESLSVTVTDDNGTVDLSGASDSATWTYSGTSSNVYDLNIVVGLPTSAAGSAVTVTLAPGMAYTDDGSSNTQLAGFLSGAIGKTPDTTGATYGYSNDATGTRVYNIKDGTSAITIPLRIKADEPYRLSAIANAVTVNLTSGATDMTQVLEAVNDSPNYQAIYYNWSSRTWMAGTDRLYKLTDFSVTSPFHTNGFYNGSHHTTCSNALAQQVKMTITLDNPDAKVTSADSAWTCTDKGNGVYEMSCTNLSGTTIQIPWAIEFPSADFTEGDKVVATCVTTETYYDGTTASVDTTRSFTIAPDEYTFVGFSDTSVAYASGVHNKDEKDSTFLEASQGEVTGRLFKNLYIGNAGSQASTPKTCEILIGNTNLSVNSLGLVLPQGNTVTSVDVQINGGAWVQKDVNLVGQTNGKTYLSYKDLGLDMSDSITGIRYDIGQLPAGFVVDGWLYGHVTNENAEETGSVELYDAGTDHVNSTGAGAFTITINDSSVAAAIGLNNFDASETLTAGGTFHVSGDILAYDGGLGVHSVENPIVYLRSEADPTLTFSNWKIANSLGQDLTSQIAITSFIDDAGKTVYMLDTRGITDGSAELCMLKINPDTGSIYNNELKISYDVVTPQNQPEGTYQYKDMWFVQSPGRTGVSTAPIYCTIGDPYNLAAASGVEGFMVGLGENGATTYYKINAKADLIVSNQAKGVNQPEWTTWDQTEDGYIQVGKSGTFNFRVNVLNNAGVAGGSNSVIYQPIMKAGEDWGELNAGKTAAGADVASFPWTAKLTGPITNPDPTKYAISYGVGVTPSGDYDTINGQTAKFSSTPGDWSTVNCIRITLIDDINDQTSSNFDMTLDIDDVGEEGSVDIVKPVFFRDVTNSAGQRYAGVSEGDSIAMQTALGNIEGVVWDDVNHNGVKDAGEPVIDGTSGNGWKATLYKTSSPSVAAQVVNIGADGTYTFPDVSRAEGYYIIKIANLKTDEDYFITKVGAADIDNKFVDSADHAMGTCEDASGALVPGTKGEGDNSIGIYNMGITRTETQISFDSNKTGVNVTWGTITPAKVVSDSDYAYNALTAPTDPTAYGYTFEGWAKSASATEAITLPNTFGYDNLTYYGVWTAEDFTVSYAAGANGSVTGGPEDVAYNGNPTMTGVTASPSSGYYATGWDYTMDDGSGTPATGHVADPKTVAILGATTFTATFAPELAVNYVNGAHGAFTENVDDETLFSSLKNGDALPAYAGDTDTEDTNAQNKDNPKAAEGWHFTGWSPAEVNPITGNQTYTAQWAENSYQVTYVAGSHGSVTGAAETVKYNAQPVNGATATADSGYKWENSWSYVTTKDDGTEVKGTTDDPKKVAILGNTVFTANFAEGYTVDAQSAIMTAADAKAAFGDSTDKMDLAGSDYNNATATTGGKDTENIGQTLADADWAAIQAGTPGLYQVTYSNDDDASGETVKTVIVLIVSQEHEDGSIAANDFEYKTGADEPTITDEKAIELAKAEAFKDNIKLDNDKIAVDADQLAAINAAKDAGVKGPYPLTFTNTETGDKMTITVTLKGEVAPPVNGKDTISSTPGIYAAIDGLTNVENPDLGDADVLNLTQVIARNDQGAKYNNDTDNFTVDASDLAAFNAAKQALAAGDKSKVGTYTIKVTTPGTTYDDGTVSEPVEGVVTIELFSKGLIAFDEPNIAANDFSHAVSDGQLTDNQFKDFSGVVALDKNGNEVPAADITIDAAQKQAINDAIANGETGSFPLTFSWTDADGKTVKTTVQVTLTGASDISVTKKADVENPAPGDIINYTITVTNGGPATSKTVWVKDNIPANTTFVSCDETGVVAEDKSYVNWTPSDIKAGESVDLTLVVKVNDSIADGTEITNVALWEEVDDPATIDPTKNPEGGSTSNAASSTVSNPIVKTLATSAVAAKSAKTGDSVLPFALVLCGLMTAGCVTFVARRRQRD